MSVSVLRFDDVEWDDGFGPVKGSWNVPLEEMSDRPLKKRFSRGELGLHLTHVRMAPGTVVEDHSHDCDEHIVVLSGSCILDGDQKLGSGDVLRITANHVYGFIVGSEGMDFLTIRSNEAVVTGHF